MINQGKRGSRFCAVTLAFACSAAIMTSVPVYAAGFGISPAQIKIEHIYAGSRIVKSFHLSRESAGPENSIHVAVDGPGASAIKVPSSLIFKSGELQKSIAFTIDTAGLKNGIDYTAALTFSPVNSGGDTPASSSQIFPSIKASIQFTVTDKIIDALEVKQMGVDESVAGEPFHFFYTTANTGNRENRLSKIDIVITDLLDPQKKYSDSIADTQLFSADAFSEKTIPVGTTIILPMGRYNADFSFYKENDRIFTREHYPLQISSKDGRLPPLIGTPTRGSRTSHLTRPYLLMLFVLGAIGMCGLLCVRIAEKKYFHRKRRTTLRAEEKTK